MNKQFQNNALNNNSSKENISKNDIFREIQKILTQGGLEPNEARAEANLIITEVSGYRTEEILAGKKIEDNITEKIINIAKKRVESGSPIQHILGFAYFMNDKFFVDENVLIPRPETELLVRSAIKIVKEIYTKQNIKPEQNTEENIINILDIGTGTGCIPIEISKLLQEFPVELMGLDISTDALRVAIKNMENLGQQRRVVFRKSDIFSSLRPTDKFDIIVSNPPYIPLSMKDTLQNEVKNFDPHEALFTKDKNGVEFYEKILSGAKEHLKICNKKGAQTKQSIKIKGYVLFELGCTNNISQAEIVSKIALQKGFNVEFIEKDLSGIERVICLSLNACI